MSISATTELLPHRERLLIIAKTYPSPSARYRETVCVAAINDSGQLRRLYPVPFRLLEGIQKFNKWEWIEATVRKANNDNRPESFKIDTDSIFRTGNIIPTSPKHQWHQRLEWIEPHILPSITALKERQKETGQSLGFVRPSVLKTLSITPSKEPEWTSKQIHNLERVGWFDGTEARKRAELRKMPYDFHYEFQCGTKNEDARHKMVDWEAGALYWNCHRLYGRQWEAKFRQKYDTEFRAKDLVFIMGTMHRFPSQWLIISVIYPNLKQEQRVPDAPEQLPLFGA